MSVYQWRPTQFLLMNSVQGSQYGNSNYLAFMKELDLVLSMSCRVNCHKNTVVEIFFEPLKKRVTIKRIFSTRHEAKTDIFNFIEMFFNMKKLHSYTCPVSPANFEESYFWEQKTI